MVIVLGEELGRFRDASKALYKFLASFTWSGKVERLGFDEVFMDVSDIVDYNRGLLNRNDLLSSFFQLDRKDPTVGFAFDATTIAGHTCPKEFSPLDLGNPICLQLILGSHLAQHLRWRLDEEKGYTCTVGISTNKLLSKLVGNLNKPRGQTTLLAAYSDLGSYHGCLNPKSSNVTVFMDDHDIGKVPGIGFKMSQKIRDYILTRPPQFEDGLIYGGTKESVSVYDVRNFPGMGAELLEQILGGPGSEKGIGGKAWGLINGQDDTEVKEVQKVPSQISIEDSYIRLVAMSQVLKELRMLATSLIKRMHTDLLENVENDELGTTSPVKQKWIAFPKTLRLSTRPRPPLNADGTRTRTFNRISTSSRVPQFLFSLKEPMETTVEKLVQEVLIPMFKRLHPQASGWDLSLVNIGVTGMVETASENGDGEGRDIGRMFKRQDEVLKQWKVEDKNMAPDEPAERLTKQIGVNGTEEDDRQGTEPSAGNDVSGSVTNGSEDTLPLTQTQSMTEDQVMWEDEDDEQEVRDRCQICGAVMPAFAMAAHERFHDLAD